MATSNVDPGPHWARYAVLHPRWWKSVNIELSEMGRRGWLQYYRINDLPKAGNVYI